MARRAARFVHRGPGPRLRGPGPHRGRRRDHPDDEHAAHPRRARRHPASPAGPGRARLRAAVRRRAGRAGPPPRPGGPPHRGAPGGPGAARRRRPGPARARPPRLLRVRAALAARRVARGAGTARGPPDPGAHRAVRLLGTAAGLPLLVRDHRPGSVRSPREGHPWPDTRPGGASRAGRSPFPSRSCWCSARRRPGRRRPTHRATPRRRTAAPGQRVAARCSPG